MLRRLILVGLLVFVGIPGAILLVENLRGRGQLGAVIRAQEARGERLEIRSHIPPTVPASSNGASILMMATAQLEGAGQCLPPAILVVAPGRALVPDQFGSWPGPGRSNLTWTQLDAWLETRAEPLELLRTALAKPVRQPAINYEVGLIDLRLPHLSSIKSSVTTLSLAAAADSRRGDLESVLQSLDGMRALESDLAGEPILISHLIRIACASIAGSRLWAVAQDRPWTEPELARLQAALPVPNLLNPLLQGLEGERALCLQELRRNSPILFANAWDEAGGSLFGGGADGLEFPENLEDVASMVSVVVRKLGDRLRSRVLLPLWRFGWGDQAIAHYLEAMDLLLRNGRNAAIRQSAAGLDDSALVAMAHPPSLYARLRAVYTRAVLPDGHLAIQKAFRTETERALHETGIALRRHQLRTGRLPERLDELVPGFLQAVPIDRMDGQPLRYRRESDDTFVLWSVGDDGQDQLGDAAPAEDPAPQIPFWWKARDAVWPQPASAAQVAAWKDRQATPTPSRGFSAELMKRYGLEPRPSNPPAPSPAPAPAPVPAP